MDYDIVATAYLSPSAEEIAAPAPTRSAAGARRLRDAIEPIGAHAFWSRPVNDGYRALGLDFFTGYVWGRAAALGDASPGVVVAAFGVMEPTHLRDAYAAARATVSLSDILDARQRGAEESLGEILKAVPTESVSAVVAVLERGIAAAEVSARALFAGLASTPAPSSPIGRLWRACELLREHRGDSHLLAGLGAGFGAVELNILTELWCEMRLGTYTATRGWTAEAIAAGVVSLAARGLVAADELTADGRQVRGALEDRTDDLQRSIVEAIGDDLDPTIAQLGEWSAACIAARAFPSDPRKRAAG